MSVRDPSTSPVVPAPASPVVTAVASIAALKALAGTDITGTVEVLSRIASAIPDGLGGVYTWNSTDTRSDDSATLFTIIQPDSGGVGRWNQVTTGSSVQSGANAVARSVQSKGRDVVSLKDLGAIGDGVTDDSAAIEKANTNGATVFLLEDGATYACVSQVDITTSGLTFVGHAVVFKATASVAGDSAVFALAGAANCRFTGDITFNANGNRRWGLSADSTSSGLVCNGVDALYYTDKFGSGFRVPEESVVTLSPTPILQRTRFTSITAGGSGGTLATATYGACVVPVDSLGREGPGYTESDSSLQIAVTLGQKITVAWARTPSARSYRVYLALTATEADWSRYYSVPVTSGDPSSYSYDISANYAGKQTPPTLTVIAGTFTEDTGGVPYTVRISAYYADGQNNHSGNSATGVPYVILNTQSQIIRAAWSAPAGAVPAGYLLHISQWNRGGSRNFYKAIDVGNVTTYDFTGQVGFRSFPFGNSDETICEGYGRRNFGGSGKDIINGEMLIHSHTPGTDTSYQLAGISRDVTTTPGGAGVPFFGIDARLWKSTDTIERLFWRNGMWGDGDEWVNVHYYPTALVHSAWGREYGTRTPLQSAFLASASSVANVTGNGAVYTILFDNEIFDQNADFNPVTGIFTAPVTARYQLNVTLELADIGGTVTDAQLIIVTSNRSYIQSTGLLATPTQRQMAFSVVADMDIGDTAKVTITVSGMAGNTVDIQGNATSPRTSFSGYLAC